jgi:hypothetical protein
MMDRREFMGTSILTAAIAATDPSSAVADPYSETSDPLYPWHNNDPIRFIKATPEQRLAIKRMYDNLPQKSFLWRIAKSVKQAVPNAERLKSSLWHGGHRIRMTIDRYDLFDFGEGRVPEEAKLSDIKYNIAWKFGVIDSDGDTSVFSASIGGYEWPHLEGRICLGDIAFFPDRWIPIEWVEKGWEPIEKSARRSLVIMQSLIKGYLQAEGA